TLSAFRAYLDDALAATVETARREDALLIDGALTAAAANDDIVATIARARPFGAGHPEPVIALPAPTLVYVEEVGQSPMPVSSRAGVGPVLNVAVSPGAGQTPGMDVEESVWRPVDAAASLWLERWKCAEAVPIPLTDVATADVSLGIH